MPVGTGRGRWLHLAHQGHHRRGNEEAGANQQEGVTVGLRLRFSVGQLPELMQAGRGARVADKAQVGEIVADLGQPLVQRLIAAVEVFRQPGEVQVGAVIEDRRAGGDANGPPGCASG